MPAMPIHFLILVLLFALPASVLGEVLHLRDGSRSFDTGGYLERLDDPQGTLDASMADASAGWTPLPGGLNAGFTPAILWLRLDVAAHGARRDWILHLSNALLDDVRVYGRSAGGDWALLGHSGENVPRTQWPVDYRSPVYHLDLADGAEQRLLLRLQSKNALSVRVAVWEPQAFNDHSRREALFFGLYFGFYLLLICSFAVFSRLTSAPDSGLFLVYVGLCVLNEVLSLGLIQQVTGLGVWWSDRLLGIGIAVAVPVAVSFASRQLGLQRLYPRTLRWLCGALWLLAGIAGLVVGLGHYGWAMWPIQWLALLLIPCFISLGIFLLLRGHPPARFFLLAFGVFYAGIIVGFLRNLGYLPVNTWTENASALGTMVHMGLVSLRIVAHHDRLRRARDHAQAMIATELAQQHSQRLEQQVMQRTGELREEIRRREHLEQELRASLELERRVREQQRDFVAMVSHEFRTPLAIITTTAQRLAGSLTVTSERNLQRCRNIREAAVRLLALVDEYLTDDRMSETQIELRLAPCDLPALVADLQSEFEPGRIRVDYRLDCRDLFCDGGLLRIALRNLLANADRHAPLHEAVRVEVAAEDGHVCFRVLNGGGAIPEGEGERLFQKYYRGQNAQRSPGAGLGLYLVRRIAELQGGDADLTAVDADTVCFSLRLPQVPS
ncbi:sensor histidine kinase [Stutzerimonas tarimensis]|uniref:histidine kinase n=1 Tax=Stutzerimonas tarimensis TaxID=1507735 RepID=A0ABV7T622_9GAMM